MRNSSFAQLVARLSPLTLGITPQTYTAEDGTTTYYTQCRLPNIELPVRTEEHLTPLGAYRAARKALLYHATKPTPTPAPAVTVVPAAPVYDSFPNSAGQPAVHRLCTDWQSIADNAVLALHLKDGRVLSGEYIRSGYIERGAFYLVQPTDVAFAFALPGDVAGVWELVGEPVVARRV